MSATNLDSLVLSSGLTATTGTFSGAVSTAALTAASLSLTTPLVKANANESLKRIIVDKSFDGTLADGTTYKRLIPIFRACTLTKAWAACVVKMAGGTNTLKVEKVNAGTTTTLISTASVDPTAVPAAVKVAEALTLTATTADRALVAGDNILITLTCGTMTTDGQDYAVSLELELTDA